MYAEAEIFHYWIFNVVANQVEAYSEPYKDAQGTFGYRFKRIFLANQSVELPLASSPSLDLSSVLPHKIS